MIDTSVVRSFSADRLRLAIVAMAAAALAGVGLWSLLSGLRPLPALTLMLIGLFLLAACALRAFDRGAVLVISPEGVTDRRLSPDVIRWGDVLEMNEMVHLLRVRFSKAEVRVIRLQLAPKVKDRMTFRTSAAAGRRIDGLVGGGNVIDIHAGGLKGIRHDELWQLLKAYRMAAGQRTGDSGGRPHPLDMIPERLRRGPTAPTP